MWLLHALLCMTSPVSLVAFNVDVTQPWVTPDGGTPFVLSSLLHQDPSTNQTWLLVTNSRTDRTSRPLHRCSLIQDEILCQPVEHVPIPKGRHRGVTVVRNHHGVLICIQELVRRSHNLSSEFTGNCTLLAPDLRPQAQAYFSNLENLLDPEAHVDTGDCYGDRERSMRENENTARQRRALEKAEEEEEEEEEEGGTEIAIILDGSGSINATDFQKAKDFISNMMKNFYEKCFECSFALVQYGEVIQTEFDLRDSQDVNGSLARVQNITQVGSVTKTASAMQHVLDNIFTPSHGSREKAAKVMVVLTDGDIFWDPLNLTTVINSPKMQGVERFAIGVGSAFNKERAYTELKLIASDPDETHAFMVANYSVLDGLLSKLQRNIIRMEGTVGEAIRYQLAQTGFSAQLLDKGQVLLGAVGTFDWSGGALLYDMHSRRGRFLNQTAVDAKVAQYGYMGYSVAVLHKACGPSYMAGAPQYKRRGAVFELRKESGKASFMPVLEGEQMGSYFGSELCPVDIDVDGTTDLLLVAAPFYHIRGEEGRVYVYRLSGQAASFSLAHVLTGHAGFTVARFGFAMAAVGDVSQDKFTDVAIGAPLEGFGDDEGASFGSVYIYNGHRGGLSASPSQRIRASALAPGLHYFGTSVAGGLDFSGDGLADVTVGTLGRAAVLCSRPVVRPKVSMTFTPSALPIGISSSVDASLCFEISPATTVTESDLRETSFNLTLDVDVMKQRKRMQCEDKEGCLSHRGQWSRGFRLCEHFRLVPTEGELCEEDCFSNISVKVNYQLQTPKGWRSRLYPILDHYTEPSAIFQLPYEKDCKNKLFCVAELHVATAISQQELVVGLTKELMMNISLTNTGEDSYMTSMTLNYPKNLQLKRIQKSTFPHIQCDDPKPVASILIMNCRIGHPIFKKSSASMSVVWQLEQNAFPNRTADITVTVTKPSVMYMNTSQVLSDHKEFLFSIHGENLFGAEFQLQICVPIKLQGLQIVKMKNLTKTQAHTVCTDSLERACGRDPVQHVEEWHLLRCTIASDKENVTVAAEISLDHAKQLLRDVTELQILGEISYSKSLYEGLNAENHRTKITVIFLKDEERHSLPVIIGSSACGLLVLIVIVIILFKCGFFKRKYQQLNLESIRKAELKSEDSTPEK
ncbi:integrin alpha-E isoform X2 [Tupaia chinensis]|uniref:integrin alpha-E isoform X2 n=1 Tax=Tupaia chinensis TaxID=246437 RepID=UPI000FFC1C12|nr:integrin alpha-E isoform X2 [Tupaia chinensis]